MDFLRIPVAGESVQHDPILRHALVELERAGADRALAEILAGGFRGFGRVDHAGSVRELRQQGRGRRFQHDPHRGGVDDFHAIDIADFAAAEAGGHGQMPLQREFHRGRVERFAIMERHALAKVQDQRLRVGPLVASRELRHDFQLVVQIEQLVA